jgi:uncharacterized protein YggU (UPF0235/DUF167 family)
VGSTGRTGVRFTVRLTPRGGADRIEGVLDGGLRVRVAAAPVEGAANEALGRLIAAALGVARGRVRIVSGTTNRRKIVEVDEVEAATVKACWPGVDV